MADEVFNQFLKALERTERMPLRDLARYQERLLIRLVRHASENLPYYHRRLAPVFTADGNVDLSRWNDLPILTRDEAVAHGADMRVLGLSAEYGAVGEFHLGHHETGVSPLINIKLDHQIFPMNLAAHFAQSSPRGPRPERGKLFWAEPDLAFLPVCAAAHLESQRCGLAFFAETHLSAGRFTRQITLLDNVAPRAL